MPFRKFGFEKKFNGVLIDTNLLLLVLIGIFDSALIEKFKRTQQYELDDYENLLKIISFCNNRIYTTPNILTEITNLTNNNVLNRDYTFFKFLSDFVKNFIEISINSQTIIENNRLAFIKLGLADASIMNAATNDVLILTDDLPLYHLLSSNSKAVINYNHLRFY